MTEEAERWLLGFSSNDRLGAMRLATPQQGGGIRRRKRRAENYYFGKERASCSISKQVKSST